MTDFSNFDQDDADGYESGNFGTTDVSANVGAVRIGKHEYAVGLVWHGVADPSKAKKEAQEYGRGTDAADFFCVRKGVRTQFGLGYIENGHKTNQPSLAGHIVSSKATPSFLAIFKVGEGYYLLGVKDDAILSNAERYFTNRREAAAAFDSMLSLMDWPEVIAPADFGVNNSKNIAIEAVLSGNPTSRLKDIKTSRRNTRVVVAAVVAAVVLFGVRWYFDEQAQQALEEQTQALLLQAQTKAGLKEEPKPPPPMPWENTIQGVKAIEACYTQIMRFPFDVPGWRLTDLICKPSGGKVDIGATMTRIGTLGAEGAPITWALQMVKDKGLDPHLQLPNGNGSSDTIAWVWSSDKIPLIPLDFKSEKLEHIRDTVLKVMEARITPVSFSPADSTDWFRGVNIGFTTKSSPLSYIDLLNAVPGFMLDEVSYKVDSNTFSIKGKAYERLPGPPKIAPATK